MFAIFIIRINYSTFPSNIGFAVWILRLQGKKLLRGNDYDVGRSDRARLAWRQNLITRSSIVWLYVDKIKHSTRQAHLVKIKWPHLWPDGLGHIVFNLSSWGRLVLPSMTLLLPILMLSLSVEMTKESLSRMLYRYSDKNYIDWYRSKDTKDSVRVLQLRWLCDLTCPALQKVLFEQDQYQSLVHKTLLKVSHRTKSVAHPGYSQIYLIWDSEIRCDQNCHRPSSEDVITMLKELICFPALWSSDKTLKEM